MNIIEDLTSATLTNTDFCQDCQVSKTFYTIYQLLREDVYIEFGSSISPCLVKSTENNDYVYMILPIRLKED